MLIIFETAKTGYKKIRYIPLESCNLCNLRSLPFFEYSLLNIKEITSFVFETLNIVNDMWLHRLHRSGGIWVIFLNHGPLLITFGHLVQADKVTLSAAKCLCSHVWGRRCGI